MNSYYNGYFFGDFYQENGGGNYMNKDQWKPFFDRIADKIIEMFNPKSVLDAGCALGYLVEALRDRDIEAYGFDISEYAINNVSEDIKQYCFVHSINQPLPSNVPDRYDLIVTIEVLEHLYPEDGIEAINNLCKYTDTIIFTSTPDDIEDRTHVNVQRLEYWARLFAKNSFFRNMVYNVGFICSWACVFEKKDDISNVIYEYEMNKRIDEIKNEKFSSKIYYDTGNGFNEQQVQVLQDSVKNNILNIEINIEDNNKNIRIDPIENCYCILSDINILDGSDNKVNYATNGFLINNVVLFDSKDPQIIINTGEKNPGFIIANCKCFILNNEMYNSTIKRIFNNIKELGKDLRISSFEEYDFNYKKMVNNNEELYKQIKNLQASINEKESLEVIISNMNNNLLLLQQDVNKAIMENDYSTEKYNCIKKMNEELEKDNIFFKEHHNAALNELESLRIKHNEILQSRRWRLLEHLSRVKNFKLKKNDLEELSNENLIYNIDVLEITNDQLNIEGWMFSPDDKIEKIKIKLINKNSMAFIDVIDGISREDVYSVYKYNNAKSSGFNMKTEIINYSNMKVYLQYTINNITFSKYIGAFKNSYKKQFLYYIRKVDKNFFNKIYNILKAKNYKATLSGMNFRINMDSSPNIARLNIKELLDWGYKSEGFLSSVDCTVDIILPIYNGYEYFDKLFKTIEQTNINYRLIIINDNSSDSKVEPYLEEINRTNNNVILITNEKNLGFVKSVNKALKIINNDVVLLNSDIELPNMWLERLIYPIVTLNNIATSTPFTNCGTICSFPNFGEDNEIYRNLTVNEVDKYFAAINAKYQNLPTGVGFCMAISKKAIDEVGLFDDDTFSKGYGEENDWCQRAIVKGYSNVLVENLFVYHKHGGSFLSEEKKSLIERNSKLLLKKHPNYDKDVAMYCEKNPHKNVREFICILINNNQIATDSYLIFDHSLGGGATSYLEKRIRILTSEMKSIFLVKYDYTLNRYNIDYKYDNQKFQYYFNNLDDIYDLMDMFKIKNIIINELVSYPDLYDLLHLLKDIKIKHKIFVTYLLHDFYSLCPTVNLINCNTVYCGLPEITECDKCIAQNPYINYAGFQSMSMWRNEWKEFLNVCDEITAFSQNTINMFTKIYGEYTNIVLNPHRVNYIPTINRKYKTTKTLNIGLVGVLSLHKGLNIIKEMLGIINKENLDINIILIGESQEIINDKHFNQTGQYRTEELCSLALKNDIDVFFISSIWPETFSYTAEEVMKMGYPIASFDIGAPSERIRSYYKGIIISEINANCALKTIISQNYTQEILDKSDEKKVLFIGEYISFSSRYRVEHFQEQLLFSGIRSDFILVADLNKIDINLYSSMIIYRCIITEVLSDFINSCHSNNKKVFYDIDDFIFNYDAIRDIDFLKSKEYNDFDIYSTDIKKCMLECDAFLTSTNHLSSEILKEFPGKNVCVNRNVASLEMLSLSMKAINEKISNEDKIILGYFSGSNTHNADFALIENVILVLLENYSNVYLKTGGCIELNNKFKEYNNRIEHFNFMDWRHLPKELAEVDINLMPLENSIFHSCKSENKWMEAALVGVVTVASYNDELKIAITNNKDGFLCNNEQEWLEVLTSLIKDKKYRNKIAIAAHNNILKNYITINSGKEAIKFINEV